MKYQSEIIHEIVELRGHDKSSLHYQSECIESWIEETKGAYPKLCDYESEWLNYISILDDTGGSEEPPIGEFPYLSLTDVTEATVDNVVPLAYKSAILKGQTKILDNLGNECSSINTPSVIAGGYINATTGKVESSTVSFYTGFLECPTVDFHVKGDNRYKRISFYDENKVFIRGIDKTITDNTPLKIGLSDVPQNAVYIRISASASGGNSNYTPNKILLIEDTNGNNLYTTHLESVKMPVLTTTGKNLFDVNLLETSKTRDGWSYKRTGNLIHFTSDGSIWYQRYGMNLTKHLANKLEIGESYTFSADINKTLPNASSDCQLMITYTDNSTYYADATRTFTVDKPIKEIEVRIVGHNKKETGIPSDFTVQNIQLEQGTQRTSYESYQANILTVNEDIELRGIGDVKDELNGLTGELTQRVSEIVVDGSQSEISVDKSRDNTVLLIFTSIKTGLSSDSACICDKLPFKANSSEDFEHMRLNVNGYICFWINKTKFEDLNGTSIRKYLQQNPITVQCPLATESVKTVDLTITDESGNKIKRFKPIEGTMHIQTNGEPIKPTVSMEIPVEATTQNLASFIDLD